MKSSVLSLLLGVGSLLPAAAMAALPEVKQLETTVPVYDPAAGIRMGIQGLYERQVNTSSESRTVKLYAPPGAVLSAYITVLTVPPGEQTVPWLVNSGWIAKADEKKILLYVLEPGASGTWGAATTEQDYIETAYNNISVSNANGRGTWYLPSESYYVVGYGPAGSLLHKVVMKDPTVVAAAAFVDASEVEAPYLAQMSTRTFPTPDWNGNPVASANVPLPVWIIGNTSGNASGVIDYWKRANQTTNVATAFEGGTAYRQQPDSLDGYVVDSVSSVGVLPQQNAAADTTLASRIYDRFLSRYTRYGGNVGGNTVGSRPDYAALGVEYRTMTVDGRLREYMVYVPQKARAAAQAGQNVPLVFALHGSGMTMYAMFDFSRWWELADKEGFIAVFPTSLNNTNRTSWSTGATSSDMGFFQQLLQTLRAGYNVDPQRIYVGGQSNGCAMSQAIGRNLALSPNFAAVGCTSFPSSSTNFAGEVLPFYMTYGEFDSVVGSWTLTTNGISNNLNYWINRNQALGTPTTPASNEVIGRHSIYQWNNVAGVNVVRYSLTKGRGHSITPDDTLKLWNWFDLWQKDINGTNVMVGLAPCASPQQANTGCLPELALRVVPSVVNLRAPGGAVNVVLSAAPGYDLSAWTLSDAKLGNIAPLSFTATTDRKSYVLAFSKNALSTLETGEGPMSVTVKVTQNGRRGYAAATATVRVVR